MKPLARWSARHPIVVGLIWVLAVVGVQVSSYSAGTDFRDSMALPGTDSQDAVDLLDERFPEASGDADTIVVTAEEGSVTDPEVQQRMETLFADVAEIESVVGVHSPYQPGAESQISDDGTIAYATVQYETIGIEVPRDDLEEIADLVEEADAEDGIQVAVGGQGVDNLSGPEVGARELLGVAFAAFILLLTFRSPTAMVLPILSAGASLGVSIGLIRLLSTVAPIDISDVAPALGVLLGLGVGIDYALFIVNRHRANLRAGMPVMDSIAASLDTSGRAVVFAGTTVVIALLGMFLPGIDFLYGLSISIVLAVVFTVLAAITLIPALLGALGLRVLGKRERTQVQNGDYVTAHAAGAFQRWAGWIQSHPVIMVVAGLGILLTIAIPVTDLRLGTADQGNNPEGNTTREAYDALAEGFGVGFNGPLVLAINTEENPIQGQDASQLQPLIDDLNDDPGVASVGDPRVNSDGTAAVLQVIPTTSPQDEATSDLIDRVRTDIGPRAEEASNIDIHVGGPTATNDDFAAEIQAEIPLFISVVIALSVLLLMLAFRSLLVPLLGAALNLVSVAAAFGVVTAVFQWGWFSDVIGLGKSGPIEPFLPVVLFAMLFGLSMDYQVFLVSRMREEWHRTGDNRLSVRVGHAESGRVIVAAASIMVFVFGAFIWSDTRTIKMLGLGMAAAVLLDAFIIRMIVVPGMMHLIGKPNWWLPDWIDRLLPNVSVEGSPDDKAPTHLDKAEVVGTESDTGDAVGRPTGEG